ncbi:M14 family zinc carboxypeptidase [Sediminitomix flava]|uniref:Zinc carboxypeptidase n=1 Tax=Sediminitomix flava TaxID=379075 RepID=A0A315YX18_SEDFL|nr:M14 family zinc carboxypeptidase [Sediminitomix flava]PWJ34193.1 zinc carboxypeptidase [Sediminitomix flava]
MTKYTTLYLFFLLALIGCGQSSDTDFSTRFEKSEGKETATYNETIEYFEKLADTSPFVKLQTFGTTDADKPLHLAIFDFDQDFNFKKSRTKKKAIVFINNGIHPGEPSGIDASMLFYRELIQNDSLRQQLKDIVIASVPIYNIGGAFNRSSFSRANQQGPDAYGFRGNSRNFDLNRDFIKLDSENAKTFTRIYQLIQPDVFLDTHTSNGADYQHIMTLLTGQIEKMGEDVGSYVRSTFEPLLYQEMHEKGFPMVPYVHSLGKTPDTGITAFYDSPRYSTGYSATFHALSFITETHMLKTYKQRVDATYAFIETLIKTTATEKETIKSLREKAITKAKTADEFTLHWEIDTSRYDMIPFKGYTAKYKPSLISGKERLYYDRNEPWEKEIPYYSYYTPVQKIKTPKAYIIPKAWKEVIRRLQVNKVKMSPISEDTTMMVTAYRIADLNTVKSPFEGHYLHYQTKTETIQTEISFKKGDWLIPLNQDRNRFIVEVLEPSAPDSYFNWNFFDTILQQKEWYSSYVFEDLAVQYLEEHPEIRAKLEAKKLEDPAFAENGASQLYFVYKQTPYYEKEHLRYPIFRVEKEALAL